MLALYLVQRLFEPATSGHPELTYAGGAIAFVAWQIRKMVKAASRIDDLRNGFDAELAVGQELDQLMRYGAAVFHDFPADGFNIDHVVIAKQGVFAVETKGYTKAIGQNGKVNARVVFDGRTLSFPTWTTSKPLEQAERQAKWLSKWAADAVGEAVDVTPVLALPGWFVERTGRSAVRVYSGRALGSLLKNSARRALTQEAIQRVEHQVAQRCRTVVPTYRRAQAGARKA